MFYYDTGSPESNPYTGSPFLRITQISYLPRPFPWQQYPHFHEDEYELAFVIRGEQTLYLPGTQVGMRAGSISVIPPLTPHHYTGSSDMGTFFLRVRSMENDSPLFLTLQSPGTCIAEAGDFPELLGMIQTVLSLCEKNHVIDGRIQTLCLAILETAARDFRDRGHSLTCSLPFYANDILLYLQNNIHRKVTLQDLSDEFHLSSSHIMRVFHRAYHVSPVKYLIYSRMRQARTYILSENMPAAEIARRLAFNNTSHFIQTFVSFYGCRPEEYREYERANSPSDLDFHFLIPGQDR